MARQSPDIIVHDIPKKHLPFILHELPEFQNGTARIWNKYSAKDEYTKALHDIGWRFTYNGHKGKDKDTGTSASFVPSDCKGIVRNITGLRLAENAFRAL